MSTHVGDHTCIQLDHTATTDLFIHWHGLSHTQTVSYQAVPAVYEQSSLSFMHSPYLKQTLPAYMLPSCGLPCHVAVRLIAYRFICCRARYRCIHHEWSFFLVSFTSTPLSSSSPSLLFSWLRHMNNHGEIFDCSHLKLTVSDRSKQTSKQANIHTHLCNAASMGLTQVHPNK